MLPGAKGPLATMYRKLTRLMVTVGTDELDAQARTALTVGLAEMARSVRPVGSLFILYAHLVLQSLYLSIVVIVHLSICMFTRAKTVKGENGKDVDTKLFLKMAVWLVVYYQFYSTGVRGGACGRDEGD